MKISCRPTQNGFSLVELLLTLVLILCLAAASVFSFTALHRTANLDEGLNRFESIIRFAQAEAATTGCKVRLQFPAARPADGTETDLRKIRVTWEPDLLNSPGVFQDYTNKAWSEEIVNEIVGVTKVTSLAPGGKVISPQHPQTSGAGDALAAMDSFGDPESETEDFQNDLEFPAITFYPDGSCDSAEIVLASLNSEDSRRMQVRLSGILGSVSSRVVSAREEDKFLDEFFEEETAPAEFGASTPGYGPDSSFSSEFESDTF